MNVITVVGGHVSCTHSVNGRVSGSSPCARCTDARLTGAMTCWGPPGAMPGTSSCMDDPRDLAALEVERDYQQRLQRIRNDPEYQRRLQMIRDGEVDMSPPDDEEELPAQEMSGSGLQQDSPYETTFAPPEAGWVSPLDVCLGCLRWAPNTERCLLDARVVCIDAAEAEGDATSERRPWRRARKRDEGDATSDAEVVEEEGDVVDKRDEGVYVRGWYFKRAASAGGTSPAPLRPRHHRDTSSAVTIASQECEPGVVREQDTRCQECQPEGSQDIFELPEGEQCSAPPISSSSTAERSVPIFKMDPELARKSKAEPSVVPATSARAADAPAEDAPAEDASAASGWQLWDSGRTISDILGWTFRAHTDVVPDEDVPARHSY